jgi:hypothetical protein
MNWIKMTENLDTKPEVMMLADALGVHELHAVGLLWKLWTWLDQNITDCYAASVTRALLDRITCAGMSDALQKVGWLSGEDGALIFANFDRHNGKTAKERACSAKRMNGKRQRDAVTPALRSDRNNTVTREEKRREEYNTPKPQGGLDGFAEFWQAYPRKKNRGDAVKAWAKAVKATKPETILAALEKLKTSADWTKDAGKFIPYPASWLNAEGWMDELGITIPAAPSPTSRPFNPEEYR